MRTHLTANGRRYAVEVEPRTNLLDGVAQDEPTEDRVRHLTREFVGLFTVQ